jgi:ferritin-like metal-binding protein YciE
MSKIDFTLHELYVDELKDLWSANDQMAKALKKIMPKAQNPVGRHLEAAHAGVIEHTICWKSLIDQHNGTMKKSIA